MEPRSAGTARGRGQIQPGGAGSARCQGEMVPGAAAARGSGQGPAGARGHGQMESRVATDAGRASHLVQVERGGAKVVG